MDKSFKEIAVARDGGSTIFEYDGRTFFLDWGIGSSTHGHIFHGRDRSGATVHEDLYKEIRPFFSERFARLKAVNSTTESDPGVGQYYEKAHGDDLEGEAFISGLDKTLNIGQQLEAANKLNDELSMYLDATLKRVKELEKWKKEELFVWGPVLDYCHDEANAKRLGIGLGQSISNRILEILKAYK